jgi:hypothetical protein
MRKRWVVAIHSLGLLAGCTAPDEGAPKDAQLHRYEVERFMPGIDAVVRYVKTPASISVSTPWGTLSEPEFHRLNRDLWIAEHGAVTGALDRYLDEHDADDPHAAPVPIMILYRDPLDPELYERIRRAAGADRAALLGIVRDGLAGAAQQVAAEAGAHGFVMRKPSKLLPIVFGDAPARSVRDMSRLAGVDFIDLARPGAIMGGEYDAAPTFVQDPETDVLNGGGLAGSGIKVGLAEMEKCGVYAEHEFVSLNNPVVHSSAPVSCNTHSDCAAHCQGTAGSYCVNGASGKYCVHDHTSQVAGVLVGNYDGETWGAGQSQLYVYNTTDPFCDRSGQDDAYAWFVEHEVEVIAQTYTCYDFSGAGQQRDADGLVQDYYVMRYAAPSRPTPRDRS